VSIEHAVVGSGRDLLVSTAGDNGPDGGLGAGTIRVGAGNDTAFRASNAPGVRFDLADRTATIIGTSVDLLPPGLALSAALR
jgi:Ca2+-binding RTX toxin-like protein